MLALLLTYTNVIYFERLLTCYVSWRVYEQYLHGTIFLYLRCSLYIYLIYRTGHRCYKRHSSSIKGSLERIVKRKFEPSPGTVLTAYV